MQQRALAALNQYNVATAPTACGIETVDIFVALPTLSSLQQHLPLAVLKPHKTKVFIVPEIVATALTTCGMRRRGQDSRGAKRR